MDLEVLLPFEEIDLFTNNSSLNALWGKTSVRQWIR